MSQHRELVCHLILMFPTFAEPMAAKERQSPLPGLVAELGFLGSVLHVELPLSADSQHLAETSDSIQPSTLVSSRFVFTGPL